MKTAFLLLTLLAVDYIGCAAHFYKVVNKIKIGGATRLGLRLPRQRKLHRLYVSHWARTRQK